MRIVAAVVCLLAGFQASAQHPLSVDDVLRIQNVTEPRVSPDGEWVAYVVGSLDVEKDEGRSNLHLAPMSGGKSRALTHSDKSNTHPRFSPDGRYLGFLSNRSDEAQVWLLDLGGGEPSRLTNLDGGVSAFEWSPDGTAIVLVARDPAPDVRESGTEPPIVITRLQMKRDRRGYMDDRRSHLYIVDVSEGDARQITDGPYDDSEPAWSPDGREIAFVSNRTGNPDANSNSDIFLVPAGGGEPRRLTTNPGADFSPAFSPDGRHIAHVSIVEPDLIWYATNHLAVIPSDGGEARVLTEALDRNIRSPSFADGGRSIRFLLEDSGNQHLASIPLESGLVTRIVDGERDVRSYHGGAVLASALHSPAEVYTEGLEPLSRVNEKLFSAIELGVVENVHFRSKDGTGVEGFVTKPPDFRTGRRYPTILWIHGGPVSQYSTRFNAQWQLFAASGYVVVSVNPRGSSGYGQEFSRAIWADWGNKDFEDVMAAVDHVIELGYADPDRLGVGGWSYGGILTNYVVTKTHRFAAAISGASETNFLACYGTDHYQLQWEKELGLPWENRELYSKLSPITYVANIETPMLILSGEVDWNIPVSQSEQLYQSLRRRGIETTLVVYPGQSHGIRKPSYLKDRYERYRAWFDERVKNASSRATPTP